MVSKKRLVTRRQLFSNINTYKKFEDKRVVLLQSGGLDSCVLASIFSSLGFEVHHVFVDYGQNQVNQETACVDKIVKRYGGVLHKVSIHLPWLSESCCTVGGEVNDWSAEGSLNTVAEGTYVPMRNHFLLSIAGSLAESLGIPYIAVAFDGSQDMYHNPTGGVTDKHPFFVDCVEKSLSEGSALKHVEGKPFTILTPVMDLYKYEIIQLGDKYRTDFSLSWSCYNSLDIPCRKCSACRTREEGFKQAGVKDPLNILY